MEDFITCCDRCRRRLEQADWHWRVRNYEPIHFRRALADALEAREADENAHTRRRVQHEQNEK